MRSLYIKFICFLPFTVSSHLAVCQQIIIPLENKTNDWQTVTSEDSLYVSGDHGNVGGAGIFIDSPASWYDSLGMSFNTEQEMVDYHFADIPIDKYLKAKAGEPVNLSVQFKLRDKSLDNITPYIDTQGGVGYPNNTGVIYGTTTQENVNSWYPSKNLSVGLTGVSFEPCTGCAFNDGFQIVNYSTTITFPFGRIKNWAIFQFYVIQKNGNNIPEAFQYMVIVPFVVEGTMNTISAESPVPIMGTFKEPAIPQLILHNPPGDMSSVTFETNQQTCREIRETLTTSTSNSANLAVTLGIAGQAGLIVTTAFEISTTISAGVSTGETQVSTTGRQNCLTVLNSLSTQPGLPANQGSIYMGYSSDIAYGLFPQVSIVPGSPATVVEDSAIIFGQVLNSATPFYYTKADILGDIQKQQHIADTTQLPQLKYEALSQKGIWEQVLEKDSLNAINPANEVLVQPFTINGNQGPNTSSTTLSLSTSDSYEVSHFLDINVGASFIINVGGSGVSGGYQFKTNKTMGQTVSNSSNTATTVSYNIQDHNAGDSFRVKIVKDPTYGTPIFLLDSANSKTSCPYEGGYQRDQPNLKIFANPSSDTTITDISLGTAGRFYAQVCNNSNEARSYGLGFVNQTATGNLLIKSNSNTGTVNPSIGITQFGTISNVPAGGCAVGTFEISMARDPADAAAPMSYENIEFVSYAECEPQIKSSVFASVNWTLPPPPTGVSASPTELCAPAQVTLLANCPPTTTPRWYISPTGGFPFAEGTSVQVTPTGSVIYYIGCETSNYARDRVATPPVLFANYAPTLNLISDFSANSLQIAANILTATNKVNSPANVKYKAGNSLTFEPGFEAKDGSVFQAEIGGCPE